ncbi:MAG: ribbon-helix-helix domain-containing protein [Deltaproteobacteria bacterium]|nr:ribbon-helix-helix domain-containing protein [Deltaproteobacteria bacterium]
MRERKVSTTVYLTEAQYESLKELSEETKVPVAVYIRQGVDMVLKKNKKDLPGQMLLPEFDIIKK